MTKQTAIPASQMKGGNKLLNILLSFVLALGLMPTIALGSADEAYAAAASDVNVQLVGKDGETTTLATWTYDSDNKTYVDSKTGKELTIVEDYSDNPLVYTGINKKPDPRCLSVTLKGIPLEALFDYASDLAQGIDMRGDTAMGMAASTDGKTNDFTYDQYWGLDRYNYMNWYNQESYSSSFSDWSDGVKVASTLAIVGYHATTDSDVQALIDSADDTNALRISVGQQKNGNKVIADSWVHTGNNGGAGDVNEGNLSLKNIGLIKFAPNYKAINVDGGEDTGTQGSEGYAVSVNNGTVTASDNWFKAAAGETVSLTLTPADGYELSEVIIVADESGNEVEATVSEGVCTFTMPASEVSVGVSFAEGEGVEQSPVTMTAGEIVDGKFDLTITFNAEDYADKDFAAFTAYFGADDGLSLGSEFSAYQGSTKLDTAAYQFVQATGKHQYTLSANGVTGEDLVLVIPVTVADDAQPGTHTITMDPAQIVKGELCYGMVMDYSTFATTAAYPEVGTVTTTVTVEEGDNPAPAPVTYAVTLTEGEGYTISVVKGYDAAAASGEFKFTVTADEGYEITEVKAGEGTLTGEDGVYTINVTADMTVTVMAQAIAAEPEGPDTSWYNGTDAAFTITTAAQLEGLAQLVDEGNDFAGKTVLLGNDIDLKGSDDNVWNPIGSASYDEYDTGISSSYSDTAVGIAKEGSLAFAGTFDGQGYEISGLYISSSDSGQGLFAYNAGTVKNFTISGTIVKAGGDYVGSVVGFNSGTISDVASRVGISVGSSNVGGIAGYNDGYMDGSEGLIIRCGNDAAVTGSTKVGGIAGESTGTIKYCYNKGSIKGTADAKNGVGGIVGRLGCNGGAISTPKVEDCYNAGSVGVNCKWTGGITGFLNPGATIKNCLVVAFAPSGAWNRNNPIAGNVDDQNAGFVTNVYSLQGLTKTGSWYQEVGNVKTADELKSASFPALLGGSFVADDATTPLNDGYPVLFWEKGLTMGAISVDKNIDFGTVTCAATSATETNVVTVTVKAEKNYALKDGSLKYTTDGETYTELTATENEGEYSFTMPKGDVTITAEFSYAGAYWDGTTVNTDWYSPTGTVFVINTPAELAGFAAIVNGTAEGFEKDDFSGKTVQLGTNISLGKEDLYVAVGNVTYGSSGYPMTTTQYYLSEDAPVWTPIGSGNATSNTSASGNAFAGTFDGKGYAISGVYTGGKSSSTGNTATVQGLFGIVTGTVQNVTVYGCVTGKIVVGGIAAHLNGGTIQNCTNNAIVFADGGTTPGGSVENGVEYGGAVGGIVGNAMTGSTIAKCMNNATVINANTCYGGRTGGIVGLIDSGSVAVSKCGNTGDVETYQYGGGICGGYFASGSTIDQCYNAGNVIGHGTKKIHFGGIAGQYGGAISNCYNIGTIIQARTDNSKASYYGGIGGDINYSSNTGSIKNCYNLGEIVIKSTYGSYDAGMITGDGSATNSYYLSTLSTSKMYGTHGTAKTEAELKDAAFLTAINVDNQGAFVSDAEGAAAINNGYPVLGWQLGAEDPIAVSTKYEGEFGSEYIENQKFSIGTFKLYTIYNNDSTTALNEYEVYLGEEKIDTAAYAFTQEDNGKTLKVTWAANGTETNYVEKTLAITADTLESALSRSGSAKLSIYFAGDTLDVSGITKATYKMASGTYKYVEGDELADLKYSLKVGEETVLASDVALTTPLTVAHNGAELWMAYTYRGKTIDTKLGNLTVLENKQPNAEGYYELSTADDVLWFSAKVNSGATDINGVLANDIDLTDVSLHTMSNYAGVFDGNGKTLNVNAALFNSITTGTVKNLTLTGAVSGSGNTSALVKTISGAATIEKVTNKVTVTMTGGYIASNFGGIVANVTAEASGAKIIGCVNTGNLVYSGSYQRYSHVGFIAGVISCADVTVSQCVNTGSISQGTGWGNNYGGIVGNNAGVITDCYNTGNVTNTQTFAYNGGGIAGTSSGTITNCYTTGTVTFYGNGAAIVGTNSGTITNSYALTGTNGVLVNGDGTIDEASAFKSEEDMKVAAFVALLNADREGDEAVWNVDIEGESAINNGYPVLAWQLPAEPEPEVLLGDVDGNGKVNHLDASLVFDYHMGYTTSLDEKQLAAADVNGDGKVNHLDASGIFDYHMGYITSFDEL